MSKQKLSQQDGILEIVVGVKPIVISPLNAKKGAMSFLYLIKHMLWLVFKILMNNLLSIFHELSHSIQIINQKLQNLSVDFINLFIKL